MNRSIFDFLDCENSEKLEAGRLEANERIYGLSKNDKRIYRPKTNTHSVPALTLYCGALYRPEFKQVIRRALEQGLHCLIISAGYGLVRPEERIHTYSVQMGRMKSVWRKYLPSILKAYVSQNKIERTFITCSQDYVDAFREPRAKFPELNSEVYSCIPTARDGKNKYVDVGEQSREALQALLDSPLGAVPHNWWKFDLAISYPCLP